MKKNKELNLIKFYYISIFLFYNIIGLIILKYYKFQISPDTVSYISIAKKYAMGDFVNAINGYWSPLVSWLLIPFYYFKGSELVSWTILSLVIGNFTIFAIIRLLKNFFLNNNFVSLLFTFISSIIVLNYAYSDSPSDLLLILFLILYFSKLFDGNYYEKKNNDAIAIGIMAGFAYLSKSYAFPFFIVHYFVINLIYYYRNKLSPEIRKRIINNYIKGMIAFFIIVTPWIAFISLKYNKITFSTSGQYNYALVGPQSKGHPMFYKGLLDPPNKTAISNWEDPSYLGMPTWSPFQSKQNFKHQIGIIIQNYFKILKILKWFSQVSLIILLLYLIIAIRPIKQLIRNNRIVFPLLTMVIYCSGYLMVLVENRYLWLCPVFLLLMGGYVILNSLKFRFFSSQKILVMLLLLALSFISYPIKNLRSHVNSGRNSYELSQKLKGIIRSNSKIAANKHMQTLYLAFYLNDQYYGQIQKGKIGGELIKRLREKNINYFFVWGDDFENTSTLFAIGKEIFNDKKRKLKIYKITNSIRHNI